DLAAAGVDDQTGLQIATRGLALKNVGRYKEAYENLRAAIDKVRVLGPGRLLAPLLGNYANVCLFLNRGEEAGRALREAKELGASFGQLDQLSITLGRQATLALTHQDFWQAAF